MIPRKNRPPGGSEGTRPGEALRARGLRLTRARRAILEIVQASAGHPSAPSVFVQARRRLPRVSLGTVYRNLRRLAAEGLLREHVDVESRGLRFDGNLAPHDHFTCVACGCVLDLPRRRVAPLPPAPGLLVLSHRVEFYGRCGACRRRGTTATPDWRRHGR